MTHSSWPWNTWMLRVWVYSFLWMAASALCLPVRGVAQPAYSPENGAQGNSPSEDHSQRNDLAAGGVDLLHAVGAELAVSSVYRNRSSQIERLIDSDPETAWNSRTGDLAGAWIEFRLPEDAEIRAIGLIPGFAREGGRTDLFTGNHRVSRIRVLRESEELGVFDIDTSSRQLVRVPVRGRGGVWRIEIARTLPGTRSDWREVCISELRVYGTAPTMEAQTRIPRLAVAQLPPRRDDSEVDLVELERTQRRVVSSFGPHWRELIEFLTELARNTGDPDPTPEDSAEAERMRHSIAQRIVELVDVVDPSQADAIRLSVRNPLFSGRTGWRGRLDADLQRMVAGLDSVARTIGRDSATCRSERGVVGVYLTRLAQLMSLDAYFREIETSEAAMGGGSEFREAMRSEMSVADAAEWLEVIDREWSQNSRGVATRIRRRGAPDAVEASSDWPELLRRLEHYLDVCWPETGRGQEAGE